MKVKITAESKRVITLAQADAAKQIVSDMKEDEMSAADYSVYAVNCYLSNCAELREKYDFCNRVLSAEAQIAKNREAWNAYGNDTEDIDVWIDAIAETGSGFLKIGFYLTDVWKIGPDDFNETFPDRVYAQYFVKA